MPLTNLLHFSQREDPVRLSRSGFETIPSDLSTAELFRYFTYSAEDRLAILECRGNNNKVGFALLLGSVRLTGRFPIHFDLRPGNLLTKSFFPPPCFCHFMSRGRAHLQTAVSLLLTTLLRRFSAKAA
jgi:Domain of unknown function (DUF4158)